MYAPATQNHRILQNLFSLLLILRDYIFKSYI